MRRDVVQSGSAKSEAQSYTFQMKAKRDIFSLLMRTPLSANSAED